MAETLNKRLQRKLDREASENAHRYWEKKLAAADKAKALPTLPETPEGGGE